MVSCKRAAAFVVFLNIQLLVMLKSMGDQPVRVLPVVITQLRTVPTIVIAHTFCASADTRISYRQCLLIQGYFCAI